MLSARGNSLLENITRQVVVCRQSVTVNLEDGLHLRPGSLIAQAVRNLDCQVKISKGDLVVDAENVLDLVTLNAEYGTTLILEANGAAAAEAIRRLVLLFDSNFADDSTETDE